MAPQTPEKEYTVDEVEKHNTASDCWVIIGNDNTGQFNRAYLWPCLICRRFICNASEVLYVGALCKKTVIVEIHQNVN